MSFVFAALFARQAGADAAAEPWTYYVSPDGSDSSPGSVKFPWHTLQHAANSARPGDIVLVEPGEYAGFVLGWDLPQGARGGEKGAPITYMAMPGATITDRNRRTQDGIDLEPGCPYINIEGFTVKNTTGGIGRAGIRVTGSDHVRIIGNVCLDNGDWGIFTSHSSDLDIERNIAGRSKKQHGIYVSNSSDHVIVRGNWCFENANCGLHMNGDLSQGDSGLITNALVEYNVIYGNGKHGGSAINCDGLQDSIIRCNLLYDNHSSGISLFKIDASQGAKRNWIVNNTIVMAADSRWALNIKDESTDNTVCNNILFNANPGHGSIQISSDCLPGFLSDHNLVENRFSIDEERPMTFQAWQKMTGDDKNSRVATPDETFRDAGGHDYRLATRSPALGAGQLVGSPKGATVDMDGVAFGATPDIGTYHSTTRPAEHAGK